MESLEQRTTISETLLGLVWPSLWTTPSATGRAMSETSVIVPAHGLRRESDVSARTSFAVTGSSSAARVDTESAPVFRPVVSTFVPFTMEALVDPFRDASNPRTHHANRADVAGSSRAAPIPAAERAAMSPSAKGATFEVYPGPAATEPTALLTLLVSSGGDSGQDPRIQSSSFEVSYQAGDLDDLGNFLGGTEIMNLVAHQGKLFAATSVWMDVVGTDPRIGAQVLRLDSPDSPWRLDHHFDELLEAGDPRHIRVETLRSFTFTTDGDGKKLPEPVSLLLAAPTDPEGEILVYSRDDETEIWTAMLLATEKGVNQIRAMGFHHDPLTGVDRVFMGTRSGTFSGVYDPSAWGRLRWDKEPELAHENRAMAFAEVNGTLHVAVKPALHQRMDGPDPIWHEVLDYKQPPGAEEGLRGLTALNTDLGQEILASMESTQNLLLRIIPANGYEVVTELNLREFLVAQWGGLLSPVAIAGYNDMLPVTDPTTGENVHLIGLLAHPPFGHPLRSSWYLIRHADGNYDLREIPPLPHPRIANPVLRGTRSIVVSPFAEDQSQVLYFAGYDCTFLPAHNSAWIYKASLESVLS